MTFSKAVLSTDKQKTTLNWWEYWIGHCYMTGWQSIRSNFRMWGDLMGSNYEVYGLLEEDDPYAECVEWFWVSLNEDDVYPKEFLEELLQICADIDSGKEKVYPMDDVMENLKKMIEEDDEEITG
jgi:hypothetical protein